MCYEGGIREFVTCINRNKTPAARGRDLSWPGTKGDSTAEVAMQYNDSYNETHRLLCQRHPHTRGRHARDGLQGRAHARAERLRHQVRHDLRRATRSPARTCREGITAVISVKLTEAQFEGQTKAKLGNAYIRTLVDGIVSDQLAVYLEEHPVVGADHPR